MSSQYESTWKFKYKKAVYDLKREGMAMWICAIMNILKMFKFKKQFKKHRFTYPGLKYVYLIPMFFVNYNKMKYPEYLKKIE